MIYKLLLPLLELARRCFVKSWRDSEGWENQLFLGSVLNLPSETSRGKGAEIKALHLLLKPKLGVASVDDLICEAKFTSYEYSGRGYFLIVTHPSLPNKRIVFSEPKVIGRARRIECGSLAFIENGELMLECHTWGEVDVPDKFRDQVDSISTT